MPELKVSLGNKCVLFALLLDEVNIAVRKRNNPHHLPGFPLLVTEWNFIQRQRPFRAAKTGRMDETDRPGQRASSLSFISKVHTIRSSAEHLASAKKVPRDGDNWDALELSHQALHILCESWDLIFST